MPGYNRQVWCNQIETFTFHEVTTYEPHVKTSSKQMIPFARHEYERVEIFRIKMSSSVQKLFLLYLIETSVNFAFTDFE